MGNRFVLNADVTHYTEQSTRLFPEEYLADANGIVTQPDWVGNFDATYSLKHVTFRYGLDWIDGSRNRTYDYFAFDNLTGISDPALVQAYRDNYYLETPELFLHSASVQFDVKNYEFTLGAEPLQHRSAADLRRRLQHCRQRSAVLGLRLHRSYLLRERQLQALTLGRRAFDQEGAPGNRGPFL